MPTSKTKPHTHNPTPSTNKNRKALAKYFNNLASDILTGTVSVASLDIRHSYDTVYNGSPHTPSKFIRRGSVTNICLITGSP